MGAVIKNDFGLIMPKYSYKTSQFLYAQQNELVLHDPEISNPFAGAYERSYLTITRLAELQIEKIDKAYFRVFIF